MVAFSLVFSAACNRNRTEAIDEIPAGTEVTVRTADGTLVTGKIAKVEPNLVTLSGERPNSTTEITRSSIAEVKRVHVADRSTADDRRVTADDRREPA